MTVSCPNWGNCSFEVQRSVRALILNAQPKKNLSRVRSTPSILRQEINALKTTDAAGAVQQDAATCIVILTQHQGHTHHLYTGLFRNRSNTRVATEFFSGYYKNISFKRAQINGGVEEGRQRIIQELVQKQGCFFKLCWESKHSLDKR